MCLVFGCEPSLSPKLCQVGDKVLYFYLTPPGRLFRLHRTVWGITNAPSTIITDTPTLVLFKRSQPFRDLGHKTPGSGGQLSLPGRENERTERGGDGRTPMAAAAPGLRPPRPSHLHQVRPPGSSGPGAPGEPPVSPASTRSMACAASSSSSPPASSAGSTPSCSIPPRPTATQLPAASARSPGKPRADRPQPLRPSRLRSPGRPGSCPEGRAC